MRGFVVGGCREGAGEERDVSRSGNHGVFHRTQCLLADAQPTHLLGLLRNLGQVLRYPSFLSSRHDVSPNLNKMQGGVSKQGAE